MKKLFTLLLLLSLPIWLSAVPPVRPEFRLKLFFSTSFKNPVDVRYVPVKIGELEIYAVVEQGGRIVAAVPGKPEKVTWLDISNKVLSAGWEEGLLGLAFSPDFAQTGRAYIYYSAGKPRRTVLSRLTFVFPETEMKTLTQVVPKISEEVLLEIRQPFANHNGGSLRFGPDGFLYIGVGDGGSAGDPHNNAQRLSTHKGKILRIDVSGEKGYRVPSDNPFIAIKDGAEPEIFAYGLRNPWRFSFSPSGNLIVADVGQNLYEEVSIVRKGENHGWKTMEAKHCYSPVKGCNQGGLTLPVFEYGHETGKSILGGVIYEGTAIPSLKGKYILADSIKGTLWSLEINEKANTAANLHELISMPFLPSTIDRTAKNEILITDLNGGKIYQLIPGQ